MDIKKKADGSLFIRTSPGRYTLRSLVSAPATLASGEVTPIRPIAQASNLGARKPAAAAPAATARPGSREAEGGGYAG